MRDVYIEWLVDKKPSKLCKTLKVISLVLAVLCGALFMLYFNIFLLLGVILFSVAAYYANSFTHIEYEYVYVSGDMVIDRILNKAKRKRLIVLDMTKVEIVAPLGSSKLDGFAHKNYKQLDYTSGTRKPNSRIFVMYYGEGQKVLLEPNRELVEAMRDKIPHKVHMEI